MQLLELSVKIDNTISPNELLLQAEELLSKSIKISSDEGNPVEV